MSSTATLPPAPQDVLGLDARGALAFLVEQQRREDRAAAERMRGVCHWADLHRVGHVGATHPEVEEQLARRVGLRALDSHLGLEGELRLAGEGTFTVDEFAVCELAAALGMSEAGARGYVGQSLELRDRLPRLWRRVMAGELAAWKGRQVAEQTIPLNAAAAAYVDAQLAPFAHKVSFGRILKAVDAAVLRHDPERAALRARAAADRRGVWIEDRVDGTSAISAVTSTPDAAAFDGALDEVATALGALGDTDPRDVRRAKAVGVLADPQYALDLAAADPAERSGAGRPRPRALAGGPSLHIHLHASAIAGAVTGAGPGRVARVQGYGPRPVEAIERWLADLAPGAAVTVTPVVDVGERIAVDAYEAPDRLRAQVDERDLCCVFPWCGRAGRYDLDHIVPFVPPSQGGPPGQTSSDNLARLCRFHHRVKTHGGWVYRRDRLGRLVWTSPLGRIYAVDETGTVPDG